MRRTRALDAGCFEVYEKDTRPGCWCPKTITHVEPESMVAAALCCYVVDIRARLVHLSLFNARSSQLANHHIVSEQTQGSVCGDSARFGEQFSQKFAGAL
jgi:hypothetical protein